jgi:hypothetical protein
VPACPEWLGTLVRMLGSAEYEGSSAFLRRWPKVLLGLGLIVLVYGASQELQWAALFGLAAWLHGRLLPWRFTITAEGIELTYPFGRHRFLPKPGLRIRMEHIGAVAMSSARPFGCLLMDGVLYEPSRAPRLRAAFVALDYEIV